MTTADLKSAGLKVTLPRTKILEILEGSTEKHRSAEDIYRQLIADDNDVGLATVYRVLAQFEKAGLVQRHNFESGQAVFELERGDHHDHMVSLKSGRVVEFYDDVIEKRQQELAEENGFVITDHSMTLYGHFKDEE